MYAPAGSATVMNAVTGPDDGAAPPSSATTTRAGHATTQATATSIIRANLNCLLGMDPQTDMPVYQSETTNLWKEEYGASFFARSVQLKCFQQITANTVGIRACQPPPGP